MKQSLDYHDLQVFLTEYKINLFRYDAYVRSVVLSKMNNAQKDILATIVKQDVSNLTKREVDFLLRKIEKTIEEKYERIDSFLDKTYKELYITSSQIELFAYNSWLGTDLFKNLPKYKLEAIKTTPLFQGRDISDFWSRQKDSLKFNIETAIRNGAMIGDSEFNVAREIRDRFEIAGREATTLVRTANASISNQAQAHLIDLNSDILYGKQHVSTLDSRTSDTCRMRDGLRWTIDNEPIGHDVIFIEPPLHYNCRSIIIMLIDKKHPKTRASEFGEVDGSINYEKWLKSQSDSYQDKILGKTRARWFREDKLDFRKMLNQEDRPLTIEQLRNKYNL